TFAITIANVNDAPVVAVPLPTRSAKEDAIWTYTVPAETFADVDAGDTLSLGATLADGSTLPTWLEFDAVTGTFSGTPANADVGTVSVQVTATDVAGATAASTFAINIANVNDAPATSAPLTAQSATEDAPWTYTVPPGTFTDADAGDSVS